MTRWLLSLSFILFCSSVSAQRMDAPPPFMTKTLDKVTAVLDPSSGRFAVRHSDGRTILFVGQTALTSHISVKIGSLIYSNFRWVVFNRDPKIVDLGKGVAEALTDRLRYTWNIKGTGGEYRVIQDLIPVSDGKLSEVRIRVAVENRSTKAVPIGIAMVQDIDAAGNDNAHILINGNAVKYERAFRGGEIPDTWTLDVQTFAPDSLAGKLFADGLTKPDVLIPGRWTSHGRLGTAVYGYTTSGQYIWDTAVFLQWDETEKGPGAAREVTTAVGLSGPKPRMIGTFGKRFIVRTGGLYLITDVQATVKLSLTVDAAWERAELRDDSWDTTVVLQPYKPFFYELAAFFRYKTRTDSVGFFKQSVGLIESDRDIGVAQMFVGEFVTVQPTDKGDSLFLMQFGYNDARLDIVTLDEPTTIRVTSSNGFYRWVPSSIGNIVLPPDTTVAFYLPSRSLTQISCNDINHPPLRILNHPLPLLDGSGGLIETDKPVLCYQWNPLDNITSQGIEPDRLRYHFRCDPLIPVNEYGYEHVFIPYRKDVAKRGEDFVRVLAAYDSTDVSLFEGSPPIRINRTERIDTLLSAPTVIQSTKPVCVTQLVMDWKYTESDTMAVGGLLTLMPPNQWGRKYFAYVNGWQGLFSVGWGNPTVIDTSRFYLRIIAHKDSASSIKMNGAPIPRGSFSSVGDYVYMDFPTQFGFFYVESEHTCLVISYGAGYGYANKNAQNEAFIPPYKY